MVDSTRAYGEWVAQVDWALSPADFFLTPEVRDSGFRRVENSLDSLPMRSLKALTGLPLQPYRLMHENSEHFGLTAMYAYRTWHRHAILHARRGNLGVALIYSAFADHYLEDLFAPGHVFVPRAGLNDVLSGGMHNRNNRLGLNFLPANLQSLQLLLEESDQVVDGLAPSLRDLRRVVCAKSSSITCLQMLNGKRVPMFGDNQLGRSPTQELLVTLLIAQSVADIVDAWLTPQQSDDVVDRFMNLKWCGYRMDSAAKGPYRWTSPTFELPFGRFERVEGSGLPPHEKWLTVRGASSNGIGDSTGVAVVGVERMWRAQPGAWFGLTPGRRGGAANTEDRSTFWGLEARIPLAGSDKAAFGPYWRVSRAFNAINARGSYVFGFLGSPARRTGEVNLGYGLELGFSLLHFELRPEVAYNTRGVFRGAVVTSASFTVPKRGKHIPATQLVEERSAAENQSCLDSSNTIIP